MARPTARPDPEEVRRWLAVKAAVGSGASGSWRPGRWQARYYGPDTVYHSGPITFQTKGDAHAWLAENDS